MCGYFQKYVTIYDRIKREITDFDDDMKWKLVKGINICICYGYKLTSRYTYKLFNGVDDIPKQQMSCHIYCKATDFLM